MVRRTISFIWFGCVVLSCGAGNANESLQRQQPGLRELSENLVRAMARSVVMPAYPEGDRASGVSGPAVVEFVIDLDGRVTQPQIVVAPDQTIGDAVIDAISQWTFSRMHWGNPPQAVEVLGDLTFYFVIDNGKAQVLNPRDLPPGKTFPHFPQSLREKQMLEQQQEALQHSLQDMKQLPPSAFPDLPPEFRKQLEARGCTIPQSELIQQPNNVTRGEFARKGQTDWAILCSKGAQSSIIMFWGAPTACPAELAAGTDKDFLEGIQSQDSNGWTFERTIQSIKPSYINDIQNDTEVGGSWSTKPPDYRAIAHSGIQEDVGTHFGHIYYCARGKWYTFDYTNE